MVSARNIVAFAILGLSPFLRAEEDLGAMWGTAAEEAKYYPIVNIPIPPGVPMRPGSFEILPDGRLAAGTRRGDIYFIKGAFDSPPAPEYHLFASGQDEIFALSWKDGAMTATTWGEVTRISDTDGDEVADRYDTLTNEWGYAEGHEFAFGSKPDPEGNIWVALGLSGSYESHNLFRGWAVKVTPDGKMIPVCSGLRSPGGVGANAQGAMFVTESQGPWNGCCSLKHLKPGAFLGHPASYNWYPFSGTKAPQVTPNTNSRMGVEKKRVKELVPPAVKFPYIKMGRSISGFRLDNTGGKFGPFGGQLFLGDYTQSIIMRATTEQVNGVWQGACYPFREGLATGIMNVEFSPDGPAHRRRLHHEPSVAGARDRAVCHPAHRLEWRRTLRDQGDQHSEGRLSHHLHQTRGQAARRADRCLQHHHLHAHLPRRLRQPRGGPDDAARDRGGPRGRRTFGDGAFGSHHGRPHPRLRPREDPIAGRQTSPPHQGLLHRERNPPRVARDLSPIHSQISPPLFIHSK